MKNIFLIFLIVLLSNWAIAGCSNQIQPMTTTTATLKPVAISEPTATFLPTVTLRPFIVSPFPTATFTPVPKDIFDNFQPLSGNCKLSFGGVPGRDNSFQQSLSNVSVDFDRQEYYSGNHIKLSASADIGVIQYELLRGANMQVIVEDPVLKRNTFTLYDDGLHGDEKADDGIYVNTFDHTLDSGIYKFVLQITDPLHRTGESITRQCYFAKTVQPMPVVPIANPAIGTDSLFCSKRIEASDPIVVRAAGDGGNDSDMGRYALYPEAVSTGAGILAIWPVGFDGQRPKPNTYMRLLDANANPIGQVKLLFERNIIGSTTLVRQGDNAVVTYCGRYDLGPYNMQDRTSSAFLDSDGHLISEQVRSPSNSVCTSEGSALWTGSRMMFAWYGVSGYDYGSLLDIADKNGNSISWKTTAINGFATGHGRVLTVVVTSTGSLIAHRMDLEGNDLGESSVIEPLTYEINGKLVVGYFKSPHIIPTTDGWMVVAASTASGVYVAHLAQDGSLISGPVIMNTDMNTDLRFPGDIDDAIPYEGGAVILGGFQGGYGVLFISEDGAVRQQWYPKQDERPFYGSLFEHQGHLFLIYTSDLKSENLKTNQVLIRELQCVP